MSQIQMFEPSGPQVLELARMHSKDAKSCRQLSETLSVKGWMAAANLQRLKAERAEWFAAEMEMLAEFEALGGVA